MHEHHWVASYGEEAAFLQAVKRLGEAGCPVEDAYTPYPVHQLDDLLYSSPSPRGLSPRGEQGGETLLSPRASRLGWVTFVAGAAGAAGAFLLQAWTSAVSWPVNVGGKPSVSTLAFIPLTFEITILAAGVATVGAFLWRSALFPRIAWGAPAAPGGTEQEILPQVTDDRFALVLDPRAAALGEEEILDLFHDTGAITIRAGKEAP